MADLWYYTSDGQQKEPVTKDELRQLAERGMLKPTDLVWTEGMSKWLKAGKVEGVMPDPAQTRSAFRATPQSRPEAVPQTAIPLAAEPERAERTRDSRPRDDADDLDERPRRERSRERWEEDEDDFDDDRPRRRRPQKTGSGARVALIVGSIAGVVLLIGVVIAVIVMVSGGSGGEGTRSFSLRTNEKANFNVRFTKGKTVEVWVTSNDVSDVDVFVFDAKNARVAFDDGPSKDCYVRFVPTETQKYRIEVWNRMVVGFGAAGRNRHNSGTMRYKQSDHPVGGPLPDQDFQVQPPVFAQPPIVQPNVGGPGVQPPIIIPGGMQPPIVRPPVVRPNIPVVRPPAFRPVNPPRPGRFR